MVALSYAFMSNIVQGYLVQNADNVLSYLQTHINAELIDPMINLKCISRTVRAMIIRGDSAESINEYFYDLSGDLTNNGVYHASYNGIFGYFETFKDAPLFIEDFYWDRENFIPAERPWYHNAVAAGGNIAETLSYADIVNGKTVLIFSICIYDDDGERLGVVGLRILIDILGKEVVDTALVQHGYGMLVSHDLKMMAHPNRDFVGRYLNDPVIPVSIFAQDLQNGTEILRKPILSYKKEISVTFFRKLSNGWYLGLVTPKDYFLQPVINMALILCFLGVTLALILILIFIKIDVEKNKSHEESRQKSVFLANMSHEMRTPLNAIIGLSELLLEDRKLSEDVYLNLAKINNAGTTLLSTVNDILDISKIEAGRLELRPAEYDIPSLINDAVTQSVMRIGEKPIRFILNINEDLPAALFGDDLRIKQIINNLLSNAFKYTMEGTVELSVRCEKDSGMEDAVWLIIQVSDTGIGIHSDDLDNLFSDYIQVKNYSTRKIEGTGLGLPISKKIAEMTGGGITVQSEYGKGSVFTARVLQKKITDAVIGPNTVQNLKEFRYSENKRIMNSQRVRLQLPYARVLIVDDVDINCDVARGMMIPYGMQVDCAASGQEAVDLIRSENVKYNAIFMDHMMPGMDGIEAVRIIRHEIGTEYAKNIPIIALTANAIIGAEGMFLGSGFQAYISKPIEVERLDSVIREFIRNRELENGL
jgi:signal transduction histidine kinase/CheY-like chemotaxis protein